MSDLTNYQKWKYSFWTLGVFVCIVNPWTWRFLFAMTQNVWITFVIQSVVFVLCERLLMEAD